jgi:hypothetical protein
VRIIGKEFMTRLEAAKRLRQGFTLEERFQGEHTVEVMIFWRTYPKAIKLRLWGYCPDVHWVTLSWKQLLKFIRRNYVRSSVPIDRGNHE